MVFFGIFWSLSGRQETSAPRIGTRFRHLHLVTRPGKHTKSDIEHGPLIVDLPMKHGDFPKKP